MLSAADARWCWEQYVGPNHPGGDQLAAPLRAASLRNLPPALIITAEVDPLRDDAEAYAARLWSDPGQARDRRNMPVPARIRAQVAVNRFRPPRAAREIPRRGRRVCSGR
ncbi:alpha/beta hydrolase fold domain-containing protein [Nocardia sp. NPDC059246]|uniref:alpha/beta hydrolase fold domain-containing protein n=1 Tax=unclassified Nocardia TaxID=2637762 RepID=UPI00367AE899